MERRRLRDLDNCIDEKVWESLKVTSARPGASIDLEKTSSDYEDTNTAYFWNRLSFWNYARPPSVILEVGLEPGCWGWCQWARAGRGQESTWWREDWS